MEFTKLPREKWPIIADLFSNHKRMRYFIDSVIQGYTTDFGGYTTVFVDSDTQPNVVQLKMVSDVFFAGDPGNPIAIDMVEELPETADIPNWSVDFSGALVTPETDEWLDLILRVHNAKVVRQERIEYSSDSLNSDYLQSLTQQLPEGFEIRAYDEVLVKSFGWNLDRQGLSLVSLRDFFKTGLGYCVLQGGERVCSAYSWVRCDEGIEINVRTNPGYERKGLATACSAQLIVDCLERNLVPNWSTTNNPISDRLADKLGFTRSDTYEVVAPMKK